MSNEDSVTVSTQPTTPELPQRRPYTLVLVGDLAAGAGFDGLTPIDKHSFATVLNQARPRLPIALRPPIGEGPDWEFELTFKQLRAFEPAGLVSQIPAGRARLAAWGKIRDRRLGRISAAELQAALTAAVGADASLAWLQAPGSSAGSADAPPSPAAPAGPSILDLVDEPDESRRVAADVERLAAAAADRQRQISGAEVQQLNEWQHRLDSELGATANAVLKHPELRRLEAAWRGLKFLVDRSDSEGAVRIAVLHTTREQLLMRLNEHLIEPAFEGEIPTPGMILLDFPFKNTPVDLAMLDELARLAAALPTLMVFPLEAAFFDVRSARLIKNLPNLAGLVDGWPFAKWRALREQGYSRWLLAVLGRFLLRPPHQTRSDAGEFTCAEQVAGSADLLWGGGHLAVGVCAARAQAAHGWPTRMYGLEAGKLEDLPVVPNPADPQQSWGPGDVTLPDRRLDELPAIGINLLQSMPGTDYCVLLGGVTVAKPVPTAEVSARQAALEASVAYQQFSSILGAWLCDQLPKLRGASEEEIQKRLLLGLRDMLQLTSEDPQDAILVGAGPAEEDPATQVVHVRVTPPTRIVPGGLHVDFRFAVPS